MYITDNFCLVLVAEGPHFGKEMLTRLAVCSLCIMSNCNFNSFPSCFLGQVLGSAFTNSLSFLTFYFCYLHK